MAFWLQEYCHKKEFLSCEYSMVNVTTGLQIHILFQCCSAKCSRHILILCCTTVVGLYYTKGYNEWMHWWALLRNLNSMGDLCLVAPHWIQFSSSQLVLTQLFLLSACYITRWVWLVNYLCYHGDNLGNWTQCWLQILIGWLKNFSYGGE